MRNLNYELKQMCDRNHDWSVATQADRIRILNLAANQLRELGFRQMHADSLKQKHVEALVQKWRADGISNATMKNGMSNLNVDQKANDRQARLVLSSELGHEREQIKALSGALIPDGVK